VKPPKTKPLPAARKQSVSKTSPGFNGNGHGGQVKKPRKSKEVSYRDDDEGEESEEEATTMTLTQKQELAEKIQVADGDTLTKAIQIIQQSTNLGAVSMIRVGCGDGRLIWG
jgi:bromodomain-containing factor 1